MSIGVGVSVYVFDSADLNSMGRAYDRVCDELGARATRRVRESVASYIMAMAAMGHKDELWLRAAILSALGRNCSQTSTHAAGSDGPA